MIKKVDHEQNEGQAGKLYWRMAAGKGIGIGAVLSLVFGAGALIAKGAAEKKASRKAKKTNEKEKKLRQLARKTIAANNLQHEKQGTFNCS